MPRFQDVLDESFRCLDRDDLDVCELIYPLWQATVDRMANASLALRRIDITFKVSIMHPFLECWQRPATGEGSISCKLRLRAST